MKRSNTQSGFNFILGRIEMCLGFGPVPFFGLERSSTRLNDAFIGSAKKSHRAAAVDPWTRGPERWAEQSEQRSNGQWGAWRNRLSQWIPVDFPIPKSIRFAEAAMGAGRMRLSVVERVATAWKLACIYIYTYRLVYTHVYIYPYILYTSI